jgi:hypothetical protein
MSVIRIIVREARYYQFDLDTDEPEEDMAWAECNPESFDPTECDEQLRGWDGIEFVSAEIIEE